MSGSTGKRVSVSSWGTYVDVDGLKWRRWSVTSRNNGRVGYLELHPSLDAVNALMIAELGFEWEDA